jgi:hypothetical protein
LALLPALPELLPAVAWVSREILTLFGDIEQRLGLGSRWEIPDVGNAAFRETPSSQMPIFKEDDYLHIKSYGGRTLEYVKLMFFMLSDDTKEAMDVVRTAFSPRVALPSPMLQFAFRTYARTLASEVEGTISATKFFIEAAVQRGTVTLSETDRASLEDGEIEDRFVAACNLWAREFGKKYVLKKAGPNWESMRRARVFRNRITHPNSLKSLRVDIALMETLVGAHDFFLEGWGEGLYLIRRNGPRRRAGSRKSSRGRRLERRMRSRRRKPRAMAVRRSAGPGPATH